MWSSSSVLPTMSIKVFVNNNYLGIVRALCDTGSQANIVMHPVIKNHYAYTSRVNRTIVGVETNSVSIRNEIIIAIQPWFDSKERVVANFLVMPPKHTWRTMLPEHDIPNTHFSTIFPVEQLADPLFWKSSPILVILGIEVWSQIIREPIHQIGPKLVSQESKFGKVVMGIIENGAESSSQGSYSVQIEKNDELCKSMERFWQFEDLAMCSTKNSDHELCEKIFQEQHYRDSDGRFVVPIPLKHHAHDIGSSRHIALKRFLMLEKRFHRDKAFHEKYIQFMREFESMNHMKLAKYNERLNGELTYYVPHHGVSSDVKFRVVFDASCKTDKNISLNDVQLVGEKLQRDLNEIVMRCRRHKIAISADIKMMYRQVKIIPEHWNLQRIFWREDTMQPIKEYCIIRVIYGMASAPHSSIRAMMEGSKSFSTQYPEAVHAINNDFYVDDVLTGAKTENEAIKLAKDLKFVLEQYGFPLRKWRSNSKFLVQELEGEQERSLNIGDIDNTSVLGLKWLLDTDEFTYEVKNSTIHDKLTKRIILGKIAQLYDPNGFVAPFITSAKIFMQCLWKEKLEWDTPLSEQLSKEWNVLWANIKLLEHIRVPRYLGNKATTAIQLHGFADASSRAYGAVIYIRLIDDQKGINAKIISAKSRIAPVKVVTIPRLELAAAELLSNLYAVVNRAMEWPSVPTFLWSDSSVILHWLNKDEGQLKTFVANRVKRIRANTNIKCWHHIRTEQNPADLISRGIEPKELLKNQLWWNGPQWLSEPQETWPKPLQLSNTELMEAQNEEKSITHVCTITNEIRIGLRLAKRHKNSVKLMSIFELTNDLSKILRIVAYVIRFVNKCKVHSGTDTVARVISPNRLPDEEEKTKALQYLVLVQQQIQFERELRFLRAENETSSRMDFPEKSKLRNLKPILDEQGIMRVGGRIDKASCSYDQKHPIIIPHGTRLSYLIIHQTHCATEHGSTQVMIQVIRE